MRLYEGLFAFQTNVAPEDRKAHEKGLESLIEKSGGKILEKTEMGKRSFGYEVKKFRDGHFVFVQFQLEPLKANELQKALQLSPDVLKFMITQKPAAPKPSKKPARIKKTVEKATAAS